MRDREDCHRNRWFWGFRMIGWVIVGSITAAALALLFGYFVMLLWNWLMPEIFGLTTITFWQAFGITLLARLVFGGFNHHGHSSKRSRYGKKHFAKHCGRKSWKNGSAKDWHYFDKYWDEEGEKSFKEYVDRQKSN
ncbi:MAG: hypothetical protein AB7S48_00840 [Bacteroidales bacterium]